MEESGWGGFGNGYDIHWKRWLDAWHGVLARELQKVYSTKDMMERMTKIMTYLMIMRFTTLHSIRALCTKLVFVAEQTDVHA